MGIFHGYVGLPKGMHLWNPPKKISLNIQPMEMKVDIPKSKGFRSAMQSYFFDKSRVTKNTPDKRWRKMVFFKIGYTPLISRLESANNHFIRAIKEGVPNSVTPFKTGRDQSKPCTFKSQGARKSSKTHLRKPGLEVSRASRAGFVEDETYSQIRYTLVH